MICCSHCIFLTFPIPVPVITEIGQSSRNYCELSGRTQPVIGDVVVALINAGISIQGLETFAKRESRTILQPPQQISSTKQLSLLQAGTKNSHPSHIPNHLPVLPDPHAYIRTPVRFNDNVKMSKCKNSHLRKIWTFRRTNNPSPSTKRSGKKLPIKRKTWNERWRDF